VEASKLLMLENMKKLARVANTTQIVIKAQFVLPNTRRFYVKPSFKNKNGNTMTAAITALTNVMVIGATLERIF